MAGLNKRRAEYVPAEYRARLDRLSKADLMEVAWSFAQLLEGEIDGEAFNRIRREYDVLCTNAARKPVRV